VTAASPPSISTGVTTRASGPPPVKTVCRLLLTWAAVRPATAALKQVQVGLRRREDRARVDRAGDAAGQGGRAARGGAGDGVLQRGAVFGDLALQFSVRDAVLNQTALLLFDRLQRGLPAAWIEVG
jgi:hypothetical protein